jgi:hypothetical protein
MRSFRARGISVGTLLSAALLVWPLAQADEPEPCAASDPLRQPFFGDLHVHTRYSLDASTQGTRTTPAQAYRFARGERVGLQPWTEDGRPMRGLQLRRPLDFAMVSDHAELIGEVQMCNTPGLEGHDAWQCRLYRWWPRGAYYMFNFMATIGKTHMGMCGENGSACLEAALDPWREMQRAAEQFLDRSSTCSFTTFVGYEWTGMEADGGGNLHRNVVFRNATVPELPPAFIEYPSPEQLWQALDEQCNGGDEGCDSLVIPHNSNLSAGYMFNGLGDGGESMTPAYAETRARFEPLVEIMQHKGASECFFAAGVTEDELCAFEQLPEDNIAGFDIPPKPDTGFVRRALADGMAIAGRIGTNPYRFGLIASTDTHLGTPGAAEEDRFLGHGGAGVPARDAIPPGLPDNPRYNPGGLAVLWAEENRRDALFRAMRRREAYATSGPRMEVRFFGGWGYPVDLCRSADRIARAYESGVPMGGVLADPPPGGKPTFLLAARQDPGTAGSPGVPLQRVQLIKGWIDAQGQRRERVVDVAGRAGNGADVDSRTCEQRGEGHAELCTVWTDPDFSPSEQAFYYARVVENPSCRWSQRMCVAAGVDCARPDTITAGFEGCCAADHRPVIQERAWTSPIWYPADQAAASSTAISAASSPD